MFEQGEMVKEKPNSSNDTEGISDQIESLIRKSTKGADFQTHLDYIKKSTEQQKRSLADLSFSSAKKKTNAMFRSTGEQVGHLMFRKSGHIKNHEQLRKFKEDN